MQNPKKEMVKNKLSTHDIESVIRSTEFIFLPDGKTTVCQLTLNNGYTVIGVSACVDPANFDSQLGSKIARENAVKEIWPLEGYLLAQRLYEAKENM